MNARFMYMPYIGPQYPYRMPGQPSYCMPYVQTDLGVPLYYVNSYPQMPVIPCDPYGFNQQSMPVMLRPPFHQFLPPPPPFAQQNSSVAAAARYPIVPGSNQSLNRQVPNENARGSNSTKPGKTKKAKSAKQDSNTDWHSKTGTLKAPGSRPRADTSVLRRSGHKKNKTRKSKRKKIHLGPRPAASKNTSELSSINTDNTPLCSDSANREVEFEDEDADYETCEELEEMHPETTSDPMNRGRSREKVASNCFSFRIAKTKSSKAELLISTETDRTPLLARYPATDDYWAAISGMESLWNRSEDSVLCCTGKECKCKRCANTTRTDKMLLPTPPDLWWDRSAGMDLFSQSRILQNADGGIPLKGKNTSAAYVVVDAAHASLQKNSTTGEETGNKYGADHTSDAGTSGRRLLSVDWNSISNSNIEDATKQSGSKEDGQVQSITDMDSAIVERGPLAVEPYTMTTMLKASLTDTLRRIKSTSGLEGSPVNKLTERIKRQERASIKPGVREFFQTAFTSNDISNSRVSEVTSVDFQGKTCRVVTSDAVQQTQNSNASKSQAQLPSQEHITFAHPESNARLDAEVSKDTHGTAAGFDDSDGKIEGVTERNSIPDTDVQQDDTEIPPDSIETAPVENQENPTEKRPIGGFQFPNSDELFRPRKEADSCTPELSAAKSTVATAEFYDISKPVPLSKKYSVAMIEAVPRSPVKLDNLSRKKSMSLNDLRDALTNTRGNREDIEHSRVHGKPPLGRVVGVNARREATCDDNGAAKHGNDDVTKTAVSKIEKPKRAWKASNDKTKYPTGIPLSGMLNDTIRRNFRRTTSPVAIFQVHCAATADSRKNSSTYLRPPSIDDWSAVMVQPTPADQSANVQALSSREQGEHVADCDQLHQTRFIALPVVLYPPAAVLKPRISEKSRLRHQAIKRRNSFATLRGASISNKKSRSRPGVVYKRYAPAASQISGPVLAIDKTYPTYRISPTQPGKGDSKTVDNSQARATENATAVELSRHVRRTEVEGVTRALDAKSGASQEQGYPESNKEHESANGEQSPTWPFTAASDAEFAEDLAVIPEEAVATNVDTSASGKSRSFLKRFMKRKSWTKKFSVTKDATASLSSQHGLDAKLQYQPEKKPTRQGKLRSNFASKKNRLLGGGSKSRLQGLSSFTNEDVNGNSSEFAVSDNANSRRVAEGSAKRPDNTGKRLPKEDKTVKHALYRPTLVCMASIETPRPSQARRLQQVTGTVGRDSQLSGKGSGYREVDGSGPMPAPIMRGREKSATSTPGARINSETGDVLENSDVRSMTTMLCSTKIAETDNGA